MSLKEYLGDNQFREYQEPLSVFSHTTNNRNNFTRNEIQVIDNYTVS